MKDLGRNLAILFAGISLVCAVIVYSSPDLARLLLETLTHSIWQFTIQPFDVVRIILGAALWGFIGWLIGFAFAKFCGEK